MVDGISYPIEILYLSMCEARGKVTPVLTDKESGRKACLQGPRYAHCPPLPPRPARQLMRQLPRAMKLDCAPPVALARLSAMADSTPPGLAMHTGSPTLREEILAYYAQGTEDSRLRTADGRLEYWRTQDVLRRLLPPGPQRILDVGGGTGVHAAWLAEDGHQVDLIDPVPLHVEQAAKLPGVTARQGDARALPVADQSADVVLILGPLYHLTERQDRVQALTEARRTVRPGGLVVAATINRFAGVHDTLNRGRYFHPETRARQESCARNGQNRPTGPTAMFTTSYFHDPSDVPGEFNDAGLTATGQYGLEGAAWLMRDVEAWLDNPEQRDAVLAALRLTESVPSLLGISSHLLTTATTKKSPDNGKRSA
jgi:ubiquinone/menaquinone biosynthesis C-methylase UbiE